MVEGDVPPPALDAPGRDNRHDGVIVPITAVPGPATGVVCDSPRFVRSVAGLDVQSP
jgi:hypothetical protein